MYRFWDAIIEPALDRLEPKVIVEVGADFGFNTRNLLEYARRKGATLHVIDPLPKFDVDEWAATYPGTVVFHAAPSLEVLSSIAHPDVVLIDGDHNWHTVFHELKELETSSTGGRFPLVLLHDVGWPYGQRDLYYEPERIPEPHRQPFSKGGLRPGIESLDPRGGLNSHLFNAVRSGGPRNGVLTAVTDFMHETAIDMRLVVVPGINDLGVLLPASLLAENDAVSNFIAEIDQASHLGRLLARIEVLRVEAQIESLDLRQHLDEMRSSVSTLNARIRDRDRDVSDLKAEMASKLQTREQELKARQQELVESDQQIFELEETVSKLRQSLADRTSQLDDKRNRVKAVQRDLRLAKQAQAKALRDYGRLRSRRSVRIALALSRVLRPVFRWRRGQGALKPTPPVDLPGPTASAVETIPVEKVEEANLDLAPGMARFDPAEPALGPEPLTVIVPIYNAYAELRLCIDSLVRNTDYPADLLLIDDASTDPRIADFLRDVSSEYLNVRVLTNETNLGFVATVNRGFSNTHHDVVILNSDVEVVPGWLRRLALAARSNPTAATVTPLSDNAGAFTAPRSGGEPASMPPSLTRDEIGRLVARRALRRYPTTPTGNGFCMFIRRSALEECGYFDDEAFPRGYGEENDFCMKALRAGWSHVVDDATYVFHERSASFGEEKATLAANARSTIDARYPEYTQLVGEFLNSDAMKAAQDAVGSAFQAIEYGEAVRPRLLTVIHRAGGGTPATNLDLMRAISNRYDPMQLSCDTRRLVLERYVDGAMEELGTWKLDSQISPTDFSRNDYRKIVARILRDFDIEVVHIRHLIGHTFDLPSVAKAFGIPVILSFHDFYYVCPTVHLLDDQQKFCGGQCTPGQGTCVIPTAWLSSVPHLKHAWVYEWRDRAAAMFQEIDAFVTASASAREIYDAAFPEIKDRLHIIEHGRDDAKVDDYPPPVPSPRRPIRILVPGNLDFHKGGDFLKAIKDHDSSQRLEFHFAGRSRQHYADLGVHHGAYERDDWFDLVEYVRPSFVGLFSVTAETFSHTLSEAWLAGLPVIATDLGAFKDRIERDGGGWLIDSDDPKLAYQQIMDIAADAAGYREKIANIPTFALRTAEQMAADYHMLYERVRASRRPLNRRSMPHLPTRVGLFVLGKEGARPASTYIRMLQRYFHPSSDQVVAPVLLNASTYVQVAERLDIDVAVVQRTAIPPESTDAFIDAIEARNVPLVLDLDDDLMMIGTDHPDYRDFARFVEPIRRLVSAAAGVTVSTNALRASIAGVNPNVFVAENHLDEHLWLSPVEPPADSLRSPGDDRLQILYFGSLTHGEDLEILERALKGLEDEVAVTVVGGAAEGSLDWCRQMVPVRSWNQYPDFVHWLRRHSSDFDVVAIPLADTEFNRAKSDLKFLEAAGLELPAICSRVEPYTLTVVDGKTGLLVDDDPEAWQDALRKLKADPALRIDLASSALEYVREHRLLGQHVAELKAVLDHIGGVHPGPETVPVSIGGRPGEVEDG